MLHLFFHLLGEFQLVGCLFRTDGEIDRVQSVDTVIALGSLFLAGDFQQLVQAYQFPFFTGDGYVGSLETLPYIFRYQGEANPFLLFVCIDIAGSQEFFVIVLSDRILYVIGGNAERHELPAVILQSPFHRCGPAYIDPVNTRDTGEARFDLVLRKPLDKDRSSCRIQRIGHERTGFLVVRAAHLQYRIA